MQFTFQPYAAQIGTFELKGNLIGENDGLHFIEAFMMQLDAGYRYFILDLRELSHINSSGLGVFITLLTKARKSGGEVALAGPSSYVNNLLMITKLHTIFQVHPTPGAAAEALQPS
ncbi:MAG: hypothetical protein OHK0039_32530 [Bacteroidia bacterium]